MALTLEERERRAYADGDVGLSRLLVEAMEEAMCEEPFRSFAYAAGFADAQLAVETWIDNA